MNNHAVDIDFRQASNRYGFFSVVDKPPGFAGVGRREQRTFRLKHPFVPATIAIDMIRFPNPVDFQRP